MLFNSVPFFVFFGLVYALYLVLPRRWQNWLLLGSSYFFYGYWDSRFLGLLALSTVIAYSAALLVARARTRQDKARARSWLALTLTVDLSILGLFKYFDFFSTNFAALLQTVGLQATPFTLNLILPVGISFYTFQSMSYTIDVYRKRIEPTRSLADFALYIAYFPQLMAGPIERAKTLVPQLQQRRVIRSEHVRQGTWLVFWGLFQKVYIADNLHPYTNWGFTPGAANGALEVYVLAIASAVRVYCDFSGYSDMARGLSKLLGINLSRNFNMPFLAASPAEFWRRWHMSLTGWLTDYLFVPLRRRLLDTGVRRDTAIATATFVTFLIMGIWHGATWEYVAWGALWGAVMVIQQDLSRRDGDAAPVARSSLAGFVSPLFTFHLFAFSLLFIMGPLPVGMSLLKELVTDVSVSPLTTQNAASVLYFSWPLAIGHGVEVWQARAPGGRSLPRGLRICGYCAMVLLLLSSGATVGDEFIYFQF